jgi:ATP-dependent helicase HrpA
LAALGVDFAAMSALNRAWLDSLLERCTLRERRGLLRQWHRLNEARGETRAALEPQLKAAVEAAVARAEFRLHSRPQPSFPPELPICARRVEIARAIDEHQVVIICGETGSGKSTQLPKICLELGRGIRGLIGHTQPRRIAARTLAVRIASELGSTAGAAVGYKVRFSDQVGENCYIKLMTDGILLAEMQSDRRFEAYDTLIIDEAHERSLNIDFLLGYLKILMPKRPDLKVIITSATIDPEKFSRHFNDAPIIEVSGRSFPVEIRYRPLPVDELTEETDLNRGIVDAVDELTHAPRGDILVFLAGEREIRDASDALAKLRLRDTEVLPIYSRLSAAEQQRIFEPHTRRHIVLATNVAETSITVPGVRYVVDSGLARISRYSPRTKVQRLPIEAISKSSAKQRAGRCGRTADGVCIRLYDEEDYNGRAAFTDPEIQRANLAAVILQLESLGLGDVVEFPFVDPPEGRYINDAYTLLYELGAVDEARQLTALGRTLARLPTDPRVARLVIAGRDEHCLREMLVIAAVLSIQDPRESPADQREAAAAAQAEFVDERSDFLWYLNFWNAYEDQAKNMPKRRLATWCRERLVSPARMREWRDTWQQLQETAGNLNYRVNAQAADYASIHRALLAGYLSQIAFRSDANEYLGTRNLKPAIFPGSGQFKRGPKWFVAAQMVDTSRLYARTVAAVEPAWIESAGQALLKRSHSDPHWERRAGRVSAFEKVTLLGLPLASGRRVDYGRINPAEARDIFIREALVNGDYETSAPFYAHNRQLIENLRVFEHKARRLDILADEQAIFDFYDQRVPVNICERRTFEQWLRGAELELLHIPREYLLRGEPVTEELFPDRLQIGGLDLRLSYRFEPGHDADGVTVTVPLLALTQLSPEPFEWLVPGLLQEKLSLLLRSLPKAERRNLVPIPRYVDQCMEQLPYRIGKLDEALAAILNALAGIKLTAQAFRFELLPDHLQMRFAVLDENGHVLASGRNLADLQRRHGGSVRESFARSDWSPRKEKITRWDFGDLPESVVVERAGTKLAGYPALDDAGDAVVVRVVDTPAHSQRINRVGLRRLFMLELHSQVKYLRSNLPDFERMSLLFAPIGKAEELRDDIVRTVFDRVFLGDNADIRKQDEFIRRREQGRIRAVEEANAMCKLVKECLERAQQLRRKLGEMDKPAWQPSIDDVRAQADELIRPGFVGATPAERLRHLPRYLKAALSRLEKLARDPAKDRQRMAQFQTPWQHYLDVRGNDGAERVADKLADYRWLLEEWRVSLFAQELGTVGAVSAARLEKEWALISSSWCK